jgi:hypothetical protein
MYHELKYYHTTGIIGIIYEVYIYILTCIYYIFGYWHFYMTLVHIFYITMRVYLNLLDILRVIFVRKRII